MRRWFTLLLANRPGVLLRAAGVFTARGGHIAGLRVAGTAEASVSRMTVEVEGAADGDLSAELARTEGVIEARETTASAAATPEAGPLQLRDIEAAMARIRPQIPVTPLTHSAWISQLTGNEVSLKLENLQRTGSFKERGALNKILTLTPEERARGVIGASAGNHAQAVAYHATRQGVRSTIVMPLFAPLIKVVNTQNYGARVIQHGATFDDAMAEARRLRDAEDLVFLHAFDDREVISGQGTLGLELLEQDPQLDAIVVPVGGGGLIGGIACAVKAIRPEIRVIGVEAERVPSMLRARAAGAPVTVPPASTIADGIAVRRVGEWTLPLAAQYVDDIVTVDEEEIAKAILVLLEQEKTVAEGAGAAGVAALLHGRIPLRGRRIAVLVCGGNIDVTVLSRIIARGLAKDGRLLRLQVSLPDQPGSLNKITSVIAAQRANVVEVHHERAHFGVNLGDTMIDVTVETRGHEHGEALIAALTEAGCQPRRVV
jgi:threonine dehydratase